MKDLISNERFANALLFVHDKYGYLNRSVIYLEHPLGDISYDGYLLKFHGIQKFCLDNQLNYQHGLAIDKDYIIEKCKEIYKKYGKLSQQICFDNDIYRPAIKRLFGGYTNLYKELGIEPNIQINATKQDVINDVIDVYHKYGCISSNIYRKNGKYSQPVTDRLFGTWKNLMDIIGIDKYQHSLFSYGEEFIYNILKSNNINFQTEATFDWLLSDTGYNMFLDFYIPDKNIAIEYDGKQHYQYVEYIHHTKENFEKAVYRDKLKEALLSEHDIQLIRIKYDIPLDDNLTKYILNIIQ